MSYAKIEEDIDDNGNRTYDVTLESSGDTFHAKNFDCEFFKADESSVYVPICRKPYDEIKTITKESIKP